MSEPSCLEAGALPTVKERTKSKNVVPGKPLRATAWEAPHGVVVNRVDDSTARAVKHFPTPLRGTKRKKRDKIPSRQKLKSEFARMHRVFVVALRGVRPTVCRATSTSLVSDLCCAVSRSLPRRRIASNGVRRSPHPSRRRWRTAPPLRPPAPLHQTFRPAQGEARAPQVPRMRLLEGRAGQRAPCTVATLR